MFSVSLGIDIVQLLAHFYRVITRNLMSIDSSHWEQLAGLLDNLKKYDF
jgi:hypothetical protein